MGNTNSHPKHLGALTSPKGLGNVVTIVIFAILSIAAVGLRIWSKVVIRRAFRADDYCIFVALYSISKSSFSSANQTLAVVPGALGFHVEEALKYLGPDSLTVTLKAFLASSPVWIISTSLVKISILSFYTTIFPSRTFHIIVYSIIAVNAVYCVGYIFASLFICTPFAFNWDKTLTNGKCGNTLQLEISSASINMIFDLIVVFLPMPTLWRLKMAVRKKLFVSFILGLGLCICVMNITRVVLETRQDNVDFTYGLVYAGLFAGLENGIGIIVACLPTYGPLIRGRAKGFNSAEPESYILNRKNSYFQRKTKESSYTTTMASFDEEGFERLHENMDGVPLKSLQNGGVGAQSSAWVAVDSRSDKSTLNFGESEGIAVKTELKMTSSGVP
ncbi:hypothetical protein BofuT4_P106810.1 [Botrytis cinerea T4]|uniref:Rhodopsin domain-containing protein n=1 Tax=Botryotinia fuckeliana (strain T4) TaxID=999810 RepID=G2Y6P5_BOTF4|nr:hypothetical protein BofuT4_P106810.1 [Botrytis cinerea T4]